MGDEREGDRVWFFLAGVVVILIVVLAMWDIADKFLCKPMELSNGAAYVAHGCIEPQLLK